MGEYGERSYFPYAEEMKKNSRPRSVQGVRRHQFCTRKQRYYDSVLQIQMVQRKV